MKHMKLNFREDVVNSFHRLRTVPLPRRGRYGGGAPVKAFGLAVDWI